LTLYLDTSALAKLLVDEAESQALRDYLRQHAAVARATSSLVRTELRRAVARVSPELAPGVERLIGRLTLLRVDDDLLDAAGRLVPVSVRSLDALHLVSAERLPTLTALVSYDERMLRAATDLGMPVARPGSA
jgi:predicted nucleic acid-binding protein